MVDATYRPTAQSPIVHAFGPTTIAAEVLSGIDLAGQTAIVTGGHSGLGLETTWALARAGASVVVPARSPDKAKSALDGLRGVELARMDLMEPASVDAFADAFLASGRSLNILVTSAGVMATPLVRDARGFEGQLLANHLGHFQLTARLWPALRAAGGARVVSVSSRGHRIAPVDFDDPHFERRTYDKWVAYGQSKTANALFALDLDRLGAPYGVRSFSVHPGSILTALARHLSDDDLQSFGVTRQTPHGHVPPGASPAEGGDFKTIAQGAATAVWCATSPELEGLGGVYCEDVNIARAAAADDPRPEGVRPWAMDHSAAHRLRLMSEAMTRVRVEPSTR